MLTVRPCLKCGSLDGDWCLCVTRRTFKRTTLQAALGLSWDYAHDSADRPLRRHAGGNQETPRAPRHTGGLWTCDHVEHEPTDYRGNRKPPQEATTYRRRGWFEAQKPTTGVAWDGAA